MSTLWGSLYGLVWLGLIFLPERFWARWSETTHLRWPRPKAVASEVLLTALRSAASGERPFLANLPEYKFYTALWRQMENLARLYGSPLQDFLGQLRAALTKDRQFEYKLRREKINALAQFLVVSGVSWGFVGFSWHLWPSANYGVWVVMMIFHVGGILLFLVFYLWEQQRLFTPVEDLLRPLHTLAALGQSGLSIKQALQASAITAALEQTKLASCKRQIQHTIEQWQAGINPHTTWPEILNDLYFLQGEIFIHFLRQVNLAKFVILVCCYLSMYFFYLYALFKSVLIA